MKIRLKLTVDANGGEQHVFTFTQDEDGHLDVRAEDHSSLSVALDRVQEMIDFVRDELEWTE
ncbi:MAG: hypothetical protein ACRCZ6_15075 [Kluyvera sp.]|uniref:hypothetical protein n=1 Tax=Kluyvera sp. TaxID=1538228 RepID=UPI003F2FA486